MRLNKIVKGFAIAIPLFALAACGSTSTTESNGSETNGAEAAQESNVVVGKVEKILSPAEKQLLALQELRKEHIIYFDFDTASVSRSFAMLLDAHAQYLRANSSANVLVEGHADERGTPEYNIALGERRAKAVSRYLEGLGVNASQIETVSYGEEKPLDNSRTDAGFSKNRRAVLVY
ncbi:MAG: peptidoglycan-associated lipoprotein Pal [Psychrobium sp.]|nr:peptidoglycan-associated lipoprotein Pal [Psychrobium sp.]